MLAPATACERRVKLACFHSIYAASPWPWILRILLGLTAELLLLTLISPEQKKIHGSLDEKAQLSGLWWYRKSTEWWRYGVALMLSSYNWCGQTVYVLEGHCRAQPKNLLDELFCAWWMNQEMISCSKEHAVGYVNQNNEDIISKFTMSERPMINRKVFEAILHYSLLGNVSANMTCLCCMATTTKSLV